MFLSSHSLLPASDTFILMVGLHCVGGDPGVNPQNRLRHFTYIHTSLSALRLAAVSILSRRRVSRNVDGVHVIFPIILHQGVRVAKLFYSFC